MKEITKEKALEIVIEYLAKQTHYDLSIIENISEPVYGLKNPEDCYCVHAADSQELRVGASRIIYISKFTGKIMFDGLVGE